MIQDNDNTKNIVFNENEVLGIFEDLEIFNTKK